MVKESISIKTIFILLVIFSLGLSILSYNRTNSIIDAAGIVNHTNLVKLELKNVFSNLKDMESGIRGYLITKEPSFLKEFYTGEDTIDLELNGLNSLIKDNPTQQKNLVGLRILVKNKMNYLKNLLDRKDTKISIVQRLLESHAVMEEVRVQIDKMTDEENRLLEIRSLSLDKKAVQTATIAVSFAIISILILVVLYLKTMKSLQLEVSKKTNELAISIESLEQKNNELVRLNKELESITYVSSNDLQEPLRKIQIFANKINVDEHENLSDTVQYSIKKVSESAKRMQMLVNDFMAYSNSSANGFIFEDIDLQEIVDEVKMDLMEDLSKENVTIEVTELCYAHIIHSQFRQLLYNLVGNSLKYYNPEVPLHIIINGVIIEGKDSTNKTLLTHKKYCQLTVSDNGIGFDPKYNIRVFEVFSHLHNQKQYDGTGIGLSLVKKIVENHSGFVTATGVPGLGTTVEIIIPCPY